jgi:Circularly permutated YpsA SLOG family
MNKETDGTVLFSVARDLYGGSKLTEAFAKVYGKPYLHIHRASDNPADKLREFLHRYNIRILNIAGPRAEKTEADVGSFVREVLERVRCWMSYRVLCSGYIAEKPES